MITTRPVPITDCPNLDHSILIGLTEGWNCAGEVDDSFGNEVDVLSLALGTDWIFPMGFGLNRLESSIQLFLTVSVSFH